MNVRIEVFPPDLTGDMVVFIRSSAAAATAAVPANRELEWHSRPMRASTLVRERHRKLAEARLDVLVRMNAHMVFYVLSLLWQLNGPVKLVPDVQQCVRPNCSLRESLHFIKSLALSSPPWSRCRHEGMVDAGVKAQATNESKPLVTAIYTEVHVFCTQLSLLAGGPFKRSTVAVRREPAQNNGWRGGFYIRGTTWGTGRQALLLKKKKKRV